MTMHKAIVIAAALALVWACPAAAGSDAAREIIVKFKPGVADTFKTRIASQHGALDMITFYRDRFRVLRLPARCDRQAVLAALARNPAIAYAEPNRIMRAFFTPNDRDYPLQWHFQLINMEQAWEASTGAGVTVAVVDSGVSPYGADGFGGRLLGGYNAFINAPALWQDANYHGTHVAGTIAQETGNGAGVAGIAFDAQILPVKVLNRFGVGTTAAVAAGIRWAADNGAQVINLSLGDMEGSQTLEEAVAYAYNRGVVLVAASGNYSDIDMLMPVAFPAAYDEVIAVGAVDVNRERAFYSNGGPELDLVAPGGSPGDENDDGYEDGVLQETFSAYFGFAWFSFGWGYYFARGTSMASPHVAGVAALIKSRHPDWGPDEVRQALIDTATHRGDPGRNDEYGYGLLNAAAAVAYD